MRLIEHYLRMEIPVGMREWASGTRLIVDESELAWFVAGVSVLTGVLFGLAPALQTRRFDLVSALKGGGLDPGRRRFQARDLLMILQVALSVILLVGAALLGRTLLRMERRPLGFEEQGLFLATVYLPKERLNEPQDGPRLLQELNERIAELPGVESASLARQVPLGFPSELKIEVDEDRFTVRSNSVGGEFFETLRVPLLAGRSFEERDDAEAPRVALLNRTAADRLFSGRAAVGQSVMVHEGSWEEPGDRAEVIGVVEDSVSEPPWRPIAPMVFFPFPQAPSSRPTIVLRARGPVERRLRDLLRSDYPDLAVLSLVPFEEQMRHSLANQRMNADLASGLGLLALLLASFGIFSVMSYTVSQRSREIGIRMALGAERSDVQHWVLTETMRRVAFGLLFGLAGAVALARLLESLLVGVSARDPWTLAVVHLVLLTCALFEAWLPARQATRVEPMKALREP